MRHNNKRNCNKPKEKRENDRFFYGIHAVRAALQNPDRGVIKIWVTENAHKHIEDCLDSARHPKVEFVDRRFIGQKLYNDPVHQGVLIEIDPLEEMFLSDILVKATQADNMTVVVLDQVTDPHNIGAILRSMSAFGVAYLIVHKRNTPPITGTLSKIATGAVEYVPIVRVQNLSEAMNELKDAGFTCVGLDERGEKTIDQIDNPNKTALIMGAEGKGLREKTMQTCNMLVQLPTQGPIKSLNVSVATAISLYALHK